MRKLFVALVVLLFAAYNAGVARNYNMVTVPGLEPVRVDLLNGKTWAAWNESKDFQFDWLTHLSDKAYVTPETGLTLPDETRIEGGKRLRHADYDRMVEAFRSAGKVDTKVGLLDTADSRALAAAGYVLRDPVQKAELPAGTRLDSEALRRLRSAGVARVSVSGHGDVVAVQPGTMLMVALIFLALAVALTDLLWNPVLALLDARRAETEEGRKLVRENRLEAERVERERARRRAEAQRDYLDRLAETRREAGREASEIMSSAMRQAHAKEREAMREMEAELDKARGVLREEIPGLARSVAGKVIGRGEND